MVRQHALNFLTLTSKQPLLQNVQNLFHFIYIKILFILIFVIVIIFILLYPCLVILLTCLIWLLYLVSLRLRQIIFIVREARGGCIVHLMGYI